MSKIILAGCLSLCLLSLLAGRSQAAPYLPSNGDSTLRYDCFGSASAAETYALSAALTGTASTAIDMKTSPGIYISVTGTSFNLDVQFTNTSWTAATWFTAYTLPGANNYCIPKRARFVRFQNNLGNAPTTTVTVNYILATDSQTVTLASGTSTTQDVNVKQVGGTAFAQGQRDASASLSTIYASNGAYQGVTVAAALPTGSNVIGALSANQSVNTAQVGGTATLTGNGVTGAGSQRVTIASDNTAFSTNATLQTGSATIGALTANQSVNTAQIAGNTTLTGNGTTGTGSQRVTIASDNTAFAVNATLQTGSATIGALTANQSVNLAQIAGTTTLTGNGATGAGSQRVTISNDNTAFPVLVNQPVTNLSSITLTSGAAWNAQALTCPAQPCNILFFNAGNGTMMWWLDRSTAVPAFAGITLTVGATPILLDTVPTDVFHWRGDANTTGLLQNRW